MQMLPKTENQRSKEKKTVRDSTMPVWSMGYQQDFWNSWFQPTYFITYLVMGGKSGEHENDEVARVK